jgi:hypothetical protein
MFDLFLYLFTVLFVLSFVGVPRKRRATFQPEAYEAAWIEVEELSVSSIGCAIEYEAFDTAEVNQTIAQSLKRSQRIVLECCTAAEIRALCKQHNIPVSSRGRISSKTITRLMEVA